MTIRLGKETKEQIKLFSWIDSQPTLKPYSFHIANERQCSAQQGIILKRMGVRPGVSDIFIAIPSGKYHGLFLELKAGNNKPTQHQQDFIDNMRQQQYHALWISGADNAKKVIKDYLALQNVS